MKNRFGICLTASVLSTMCFLSSAAFAVPPSESSGLPAQMIFEEEPAAPVETNVVVPTEPQEGGQPAALPDLHEEHKVSGVITADEITSFIRDWPQYTKWLKESGNQTKAVAYLGVSPSADYPAEVVKWLEKRNWTADRFFLLEKRFKEILSIQVLEARVNAKTRELEKRIKTIKANSSLSADQQSSMTEKYTDNIKKIQKELAINIPATETEYLLIKQNQNILARVLSN